GRAVRNSNDLTAIVQAMAPGTNVRVEVLRPEYGPNGRARNDKDGHPIFKRIEVTFPLGSGLDLEASSQGRRTNIQESPERKELAKEVLERFAPQPTMVVMPGEREDNLSYAMADPEKHPDIQQLRRWKEIARAEKKQLDANTLTMIEATLITLRRQSEDPS